MARYKAHECYSFTRNQSDSVSPLARAVRGKYMALQFSNAEKLWWIKEKTEGFISGVDAFTGSLANSTFHET